MLDSVPILKAWREITSYFTEDSKTYKALQCFAFLKLFANLVATPVLCYFIFTVDLEDTEGYIATVMNFGALFATCEFDRLLQTGAGK